jgi:diguanylate cyclase (GGDEF)-like protein/PAS domain S-box-containing protein
MSRRKTPQTHGKTVAGSVYRDLWELSLDACFLLHCERDAAGRITDFVFDDMNPRGAATLGLAKDAIVGRRLREVVPISRGGGLFKRYVHVADTGETLDEECELNLAEIDARWVRQQVIGTRNGVAIIARDISARKREEFDNRRNNAFLQTLIASLPLLICARSLRPRKFGQVVIWNKAAERITGYTEDEVVGRTLGEDVLPDVDSAMNPTVNGVHGGVPPTEVSHRVVRRDGAARELRTIAVPLLDQYGKPEYVLGIAEDITEHAAALEQVRLASIVFEHATEAIVVSDAQDRVVTVNRAFCTLTGYSEGEVAGRMATDFETTDIGLPDTATMFEQVEREGFWSGHGAQLRKSGAPFPTWRNVARVTDDAGRTVNYVRIATDITAIEQVREQLERQANHDALTGLPNRRLFMDRLTHALERCVRSKQKLALLYVDLDNFKAVNDRLGHVIGDELLKEVANRLSRSARAVDTVCRLSGDEFTIVMENSGNIGLGEAGLVAERIIDALSKPFTLSGHTVTSTASIGISLYPADGADADVLIRNADNALYRAKELGKNRYQYFSETLDGKPAGPINIESELGITIA